MKRIFAVTLMIGILLTNCTYAYNSLEADSVRLNNEMEKLKPKKKLKLANQLFKKGSNLNAMIYYEEYLKDNENNSYTINQLAELNYKLRDYKTAALWYKKLKDQQDLGYRKAGYYHGLMLKYSGQYDEAKTEFEEFMKKYKGDDKVEMKKLCLRHIEGCDFGKKANANPASNVKIEHLGENVNNPFTEYAPRPVGNDELIYASLRSDSAIAINLVEKGADYRSKIYSSKLVEGEWSKGVPVSFPWNNIEMHSGNVSYSPDGKRAYFTWCTEENELKMDCNIYVSEKSGGAWGEPTKLKDEVNHSPYNTTHPHAALDADGNEWLFFSSDRDDGQGGMDIWAAKRNSGGRYSDAVNPGKKINTSMDEITPYYNTASGTLYFSSEGLVNMGGLDIFKSEGSGTKWADAENLGTPINSSQDDMYYALNEDESAAYMVSNRPGVFSLKSETCCDDIFKINYIREVYLRGHVATRKNPDIPICDARVSMYDMEQDEAVNLYAELVTKCDEKFVLKIDPTTDYKVNSMKMNYISGLENLLFSKMDISEDTIDHIFYIEQIMRKKIRLKKVYFPFDQWNLVNYYQKTLDSLVIIMKENEDVQLEIGGHCDHLGPTAYNDRLGERRAKSTADYLIGKGIAKDRLYVKSFGEGSPAVANTKKDGSDDSLGRAKNRRVEFKLLTEGMEGVEIEYVNEDPKGTI